MTRTPDSELVIRFTGSLDCQAARALLNAVFDLPDGSGVVVDVRNAYDVDDSAIAFLANALARMPRPFVLRGLSTHHARLLRYLDVPSSRLPA